MPGARILLGDDHAMIGEALGKILESEFEVVGVVADGNTLLREAIRLKPDVVLVDISMPVVNGLEAARRIRRELPNARILFLTMHPDLSYLRDAMKLGASGYILKSSAALLCAPPCVARPILRPSCWKQSRIPSGGMPCRADASAF